MTLKTEMRGWWLLSAAIPLFVLVLPLHAALTTTTIHPYIHNEDTSAANSALTVTVDSTATAELPRRLLSISTVCSASTTITVTANIDRILTSGTEVILLPDVVITTTTSGALYVDIPLLPTDVVDVTAPAAGAGITCSISVIEERR